METLDLEIADQPSTDALASITRAEVDVQIATAKKYPRTLSKVKQAMLSFATLDEETAISCGYAVPRGGKMIKGPSIRMAEIALSCFGNLKAGARPIVTTTSGDNPHVIVQAVVHDLENNVAISIEKRRRITGKKKNGGKPDDDDINIAVNACAAIALRDAIFKVVPRAIINPVYEQAMKLAAGDVKSLVTRRTRALEVLKQMGATEQRILNAVEARTIDDIDIEKLDTLNHLRTSLKEGTLTLEEAFPDVQPKVTTTTATPSTKADSTPAPEAPAAAPEQPANVVGMPDPREELRAALVERGVPEEKYLGYLHSKALLGKEFNTWELALKKLTKTQAKKHLDNIDSLVAAINGGAPATANAPSQAATSKDSLAALMQTDGIAPEAFRSWADMSGALEAGQEYSDLTEDRAAAILKNWATIKPQIVIQG